jgi:Uroporphyrinogen decarboxylase (URO-D)
MRDQKMTQEKERTDLSPEEKREERFNRWLSPPGLKFSSPEAEKGYKARVTRFIKVIKLEEPDRVPVNLPTGFFPAYYAGTTLKAIMYDYDELRRAWMKFIDDFELDAFDGPGLVYPAKMLEGIDYKLHSWPGHGLADDISSYQYIEGEYMKPEEYDGLIRDPADFMLRSFLPRSVGAFKGLRKLDSVTPFISRPSLFITQFGDPEVRAAVQALLEAGLEGMRWQEAVRDITREVQSAGIPAIRGPMCLAPYDLIGDMLRGTKGIMIDMYQRPDKLQEAMERMTPIIIDGVVGKVNALRCPVVFIPLHKGAAGFMSSKQFETFYWPGLKKVMTGLIEEGFVPMPFAEGDYVPRLQIIKDMPRAKVIWWFEQMDMAKAKKVLGDNACIAGNLPVSILCTGTPEQVKKGCRKLIEACAPGGGYILTGSASMNEGNPDNLRAMMEAAKEYGMYPQP